MPAYLSETAEIRYEKAMELLDQVGLKELAEE